MILWQPTQPQCYVSKLSVTVIPFVVATELLICVKCRILAQGLGGGLLGPAVLLSVRAAPVVGEHAMQPDVVGQE